MPSTFNAQDGEAYDRVMGRWSRRLADPFLDFASIPSSGRVLDVGCGTGSLSFRLAARQPDVRIDAIDIAESYVAFAQARCTSPAIAFRAGDADALPYEPDRFDASLALLSLHLMTEPGRALAEMVRVTRPGGTVAAAVWDVAGGLPHARLFLDTAAADDETALRVRERYMAVPLAREGELAALWQEHGLREVEQGAATIRFTFDSFDDYWQPFLTGEGTMGGYVAALAPDRLALLEARVRAAFVSGMPDGPRSFAATAWLCRGRVGSA